MTKTLRNEIVSINNTELSCCIAYIIYMIVSSYMTSACLVSKKVVDKNRMYYAMLDDKTQIRMESDCIDFVEQELINALPEGFLSQDVKVSIRNMTKTNVQAVVFENDSCALWMSAKPSNHPFFVAGVFLRESNAIQKGLAVA